MFEKFTERARKVMSLARQEAQRLESNCIGTEHLLLGILQEGGGVAARVLQHLNIDHKAVRREVEKLLTPGDSGEITLGLLPFSPLVKRTIELAGESATMLGHGTIGTEHLLLGLLQGQEGIAATVLTGLHLNFDTTRDRVLEILGTDVGVAPPPTLTEALDEQNLHSRAQTYLALEDRPSILDKMLSLLQSGRSIALVGPRHVGKTSLLFALSRAQAGGLAYRSIDYRIFDEFFIEKSLMPRRSDAVCFVPEGELVSASRSPVADFLDARRRGGERLVLEFREGGLEAYEARYPDLAKELSRVDVPAPAADECRQLLESSRVRLTMRLQLAVSDTVLAECDRLARARWPKLVPPWPTVITLWKAAAIRNEAAGRGDLHRLEKDIQDLEDAGDPAKRIEAELLKRHVEGLRGVGGELTLESIRQAIGELADRPKL